MQILALDNFLAGNQYCAKELAHCPNKVQELVNFVNHVLGVNAQNWLNEEPFLSAPDLTREFSVWIQSRPSSAVAAATPDHHTGKNSGNFFSKSWGKGRRSFSNNRGGGHSGPFTSGAGSGFGASGGPLLSGAGGGFGSSRQSGGGPSRGGGQFSRANAGRIICRRYNAGTCVNHYSRCFLPVTNDKAYHICNVTNAMGDVCGSYHPAFQHK